MKHIIFGFCFLFGAVIAVQAQDTTSTSKQNEDQSTIQTQDQSRYRTDKTTHQGNEMGKEEISVEQLPSAIRDQLQSQHFTGWSVVKAHRKEKTDGTVYNVELRNGDERKKVKFDEQGNVLKDKDKDNRDQQ